MNINNSDLKAAFLFAAEQEFSDIPAEQCINHAFSPKFIAWGNKLVTYRFPTRRITPVKRVIRAILIAAIIMALLVGTVMAFPAVREAVKKFFVRRDGNMQYIEFYVNGTKPTEPNSAAVTTNGSIPGVSDEFTLDVEVKYPTESTDTQTGSPIPIEYRFPTYFPEGLVVESEVVSPMIVSTVMNGPNNLHCTFQQIAQPNGADINASIALSSDYIHSEREICGIQVDYFTSEPTITIIWTDEYYLYQLIVNADMPMEEIEKIISSIEPRDDLNNP